MSAQDACIVALVAAGGMLITWLYTRIASRERLREATADEEAWHSGRRLIRRPVTENPS